MIILFFVILLIQTSLPIAATEWVNINGIIANNHTPVVAMVLANGQHVFTNDPIGEYSLNVPLNSEGEITLFAFCSGLAPFKIILTPAEAVDFDIDLHSPSPDSKEITVTIHTEQGTERQGWIRLSGTVKNESGTPLSTLVLINGQRMFTNDLAGEYDLEAPLDPSNNEITLYVFCSGMAPYKKVFVPNIVKADTTDSEGKASFTHDPEDIMINVTDENQNPLEGIDVRYWVGLDLDRPSEYYLTEDPNEEYSSAQQIYLHNSDHDIELSLRGTLPTVTQLFEGSDEFKAVENTVNKIINGGIVSEHYTPEELEQIDEDVLGFVVQEDSIHVIDSAGKISDVLDFVSSGQPDSYLVYEGIPSGDNIETKILTIFPNSASVAILVDSSIEAAIQHELSVFESDLSKDGFSTIIHSLTESTPPQLRSYLQGLYNDPETDLVGAILIGSVPTPRYYIYYPATDMHPQRGPYTGASYQYYEDLDGDFQIRDMSQWLYDNHTGDVESEIWVSVLPPLASNTETISAIQRYFLKNHRYRIGLDRTAAGFLTPIVGSRIETEEMYDYQVDYVLGLIPGSYKWSYGPLISRGNIFIAPDNLLNDPVNFPGPNQVFYQEIQTGNYDIYSGTGHGSAYRSGPLDRKYLNNNIINVTFWFEGGCSTVDLDVVPSFGVTALYSETSKVLIFKGATMPQGGLGGSENGYYQLVVGTALVNGKSIGDAILEHRSEPMSEAYASQREYFAAQYILLGDGTLRLQEYQ